MDKIISVYYLHMWNCHLVVHIPRNSYSSVSLQCLYTVGDIHHSVVSTRQYLKCSSVSYKKEKECLTLVHEKEGLAKVTFDY